MSSSSQKYFGGSLYVVNIQVEKSQRRYGVANLMLTEACKHYSCTSKDTMVSLDVGKENPARYLYEKVGFRKQPIDSKNGGNDIVMAAPLVVLQKKQI